jgi:predicted transcriptional regulator
MTQAITIELPEALYGQLTQAARLFQQPVEKIVEQSLAHSLPPLLDDIPAEYQAGVFPLLAMNDAELLAEAQKVFDTALWAQYETLLEKRKEMGLSKEEQAQLDALRRQADILTLRKGYAMVLLKRRGYRLPTRDQLPTPVA